MHVPSDDEKTEFRFPIRPSASQRTLRAEYGTGIVSDGELAPFVLFRSQENNIVIFGDSLMVHCAASMRFIYVDGTFSRCPVTHYQLVTCHAVCQNGFSFPFVFGLLQDKASTYSKFFSTIDSISSEMFGGNAFSRSGLAVSCDFERGLIKALSPLRCYGEALLLRSHAGDKGPRQTCEFPTNL